MDITIQQRKFSLRSEYAISTPAAAYRAQEKLFSFGDKIQLWAGEWDVIARVKSRFYWLRARYDFEL